MKCLYLWTFMMVTWSLGLIYAWLNVNRVLYDFIFRIPHRLPHPYRTSISYKWNAYIVYFIAYIMRQKCLEWHHEASGGLKPFIKYLDKESRCLLLVLTYRSIEKMSSARWQKKVQHGMYSLLQWYMRQVLRSWVAFQPSLTPQKLAILAQK